MIRNNLSTRPFYNERAVNGWLLALVLLTLAVTAFNVLWVIRYTRSDTVLAAEASTNESRAADARTRTARLRASVDAKQVEYAFKEAEQANDLIDRRTFSWTGLFNQFERTLPDDVRITAVRPKVDPKRGIVLTIQVVARTVDDVGQFMQKLDATGAFAGVGESTEEHVDDQGLLQVSFDTVYIPNGVSARGSRGGRQ